MMTLGWILVVLGGFFYAIGGLGLLRMPDLYNRAQAGTKATTLGTLLTCLGAVLLEPTWWPKLLLLLVFIAVTNPIGSSTVLRQGYLAGVKPVAGTHEALVVKKYQEVKAK